jgi:hypothetical protein
VSAIRIEFSLVVGTEETFPRPQPANKLIPEWFKTMPAEAPSRDRTKQTVKQCPPFLEALTCGYIIPVPADIWLSLDHQGGFQGKWSYPGIVLLHDPAQARGAPFESCPVVKICNPWLVRTPPGYSTLFTPLLNRFQTQALPLAGLVETDLFYREVNFPTVLMIRPGQTVHLAKGTPLVQAIPIKRDEFQAEIVPVDAEKRGAIPQGEDKPENYGFYKENFWRKKGYR